MRCLLHYVAFAPLYVETVEKWRKTCSEISEGRDTGAAGQQPSQQLPAGGKPGQGFIKIYNSSIARGFFTNPESGFSLYQFFDFFINGN